MTPCTQYHRIAKLVRLTARTMRIVSRAALRDGEVCPFRHIALQLEALSLEMDRITATLPPHWKEASTR